MTDGGSDHIEFLGSFEALDDPRQQACIRYQILLLCLCAVLGGADSWVEVALYGQRKLGFLRRFFPFAPGRRCNLITRGALSSSKWQSTASLAMAFRSFQSSPCVKMMYPSALASYPPSGASVTSKMISVGLVRSSSACLDQTPCYPLFAIFAMDAVNSRSGKAGHRLARRCSVSGWPAGS